MFRRHAWNPHDKAEMSFEETLIYLDNLTNRPDCISIETWEWIKSQKPYSDDTLEEIRDGLMDSLLNEAGPSVLTLGWSGEKMAHSGIKVVSQWGPLFIFTSSDHDDHGPFRTIEDALDLEYFWQDGVPGGELWFEEDIVPKKIAFKIGYAMCGTEGENVMINDVIYIRKKDQLMISS